MLWIFDEETQVKNLDQIIEYGKRQSELILKNTTFHRKFNSNYKK
ncbi:hypothetical protein [Chryseobacterium sp. G0201]|nr:hypothetical protein [Chryseobacterium sp. G0201]